MFNCLPFLFFFFQLRNKFVLTVSITQYCKISVFGAIVTVAVVLRNRSGIKGTASAEPGHVLGQWHDASWPASGRAGSLIRPVRPAFIGPGRFIVQTIIYGTFEIKHLGQLTCLRVDHSIFYIMIAHFNLTQSMLYWDRPQKQILDIRYKRHFWTSANWPRVVLSINRSVKL